MTTTPTDLDALTALEQAVPAGPWRVAESTPAWGIRTEGGWELVYASYADSGPKVLEFIAAMRNALPALLDELATYKAEVKHADAEREEAERNRDAAREELAKTRAELDAMTERRNEVRELAAKREAELIYLRAEVTTWKRKAAKLREQLGNAKTRISAAATVEVWTNEDGKRFVFADDLMRALDPNPEANPATTAEPAATLCARFPDGHDLIDATSGRIQPCPTCGPCPYPDDDEPADEPKANEPKPRTCRECGHTANDHHPAEGSIRPIGCQLLDCDCSFTLLDEVTR